MKILRNLILTLAIAFSQILHAGSNDVLKIGMSQEFENLNPLIKQMLATSYIYDMVGRTLNVLNREGKWENQLAVSRPSLENGQARFVTEDGVKKILVDWEIHADAKWGDGTPVTGHDFEFSWKVATDKNVSVGSSEVYGAIEKFIIDKKNPKKFTLKYKEAKWTFNQMPQFNVIPKHVEKPVFDKYGGEVEGYSKNSKYTTAPTNPGLYNGPYLVSEVKLGSHVVLERNPHWFGKKPSIKKIILKYIPNTNTLEANLRSKNIDMISVLGLTLDQAIAFEKKIKKEKLPLSVNFKQGLVYEHIDLQLSNEFLKDVRVRKALVHAVNRKKLTESLFEGKQNPAIHNVAPLDPWYTDDGKKVVLYKYSRRKAKKLLDQAGWKMNKKDGYRYKDGKRLSFQLMTTAGNKLRELVQSYLQSEWKKVGIEISIKNEPPRVYFGETVKKSKFPAVPFSLGSPCLKIARDRLFILKKFQLRKMVGKDKTQRDMLIKRLISISNKLKLSLMLKKELRSQVKFFGIIRTMYQ